MRLIGVGVAALAAWLWFSRRRRSGATVTPSAVDLATTSRTDDATPAPSASAEVADEVEPRINDTGRLDASAGWDDLDGKPASTVAGQGQDVGTPAPGLPGDDTEGVPAWDRPV